MAFLEPGAILAAVAARSKTGVPIFRASDLGNSEFAVRTASAAAACEEQGGPQDAKEQCTKRKMESDQSRQCRFISPSPIPPDFSTAFGYRQRDVCKGFGYSHRSMDQSRYDATKP